MRSFLPLLLCLGLSAVLPGAAYAHGSNVFESAEESDHHAAQHTHAAAHAGDVADAPDDEFEELHEQIDHLEERLNAHDERVRMTDILGGIGYIVGISGAAYYYLGSRRKQP
jgi:hypothetical protein